MGLEYTSQRNIAILLDCDNFVDLNIAAYHTTNTHHFTLYILFIITEIALASCVFVFFFFFLFFPFLLSCCCHCRWHCRYRRRGGCCCWLFCMCKMYIYIYAKFLIMYCESFLCTFQGLISSSQFYQVEPFVFVSISLSWIMNKMSGSVQHFCGPYIHQHNEY